MVLMMSRPGKRDGSKNHYFAKRLPASVAGSLKGRRVEFRLPGATATDPEIIAAVTLRDPFRVSLQTSNAALAKRRQAACEEQFTGLVAATLSGPVALTFKDVVALAGELYRDLVADWSADPGGSEHWSLMREHLIDALLDVDRENSRTAWATLEQQLHLDRFLSARNLLLDHDTRRRLTVEAGKAAAQGAAVLERMAVGDYRPDPLAERFPSRQAPTVAAPISEGAVTSFKALFDRWRKAGDKAPSTVSNWRIIVDQFKAFLGHDDPGAVTQVDVIRWKDALLAEGRKRIDDTSLACLKAVYAPAVAEQAVTGIRVNPALGVSARQSRRQAGHTKLPYRDDEVAKLLSLAASETNPAKRWLPLLLACTGARVGELAQIWAENVVEVDGIPALHIVPAPDGGTLKNEVSERTIPLHPELMRQGFLAAVRKKGSGPLFYAGKGRRAARAREDGERRHASKGVANRLASWIREAGFSDARKAPSHAFRHWMKTALLKAGAPERVADAIQGHAGRSEADTYRHVDLKMMAEALARVPIPTEFRSGEKPEPSSGDLSSHTSS